MVLGILAKLAILTEVVILIWFDVLKGSIHTNKINSVIKRVYLYITLPSIRMVGVVHERVS